MEFSVWRVGASGGSGMERFVEGDIGPDGDSFTMLEGREIVPGEG